MCLVQSLSLSRCTYQALFSYISVLFSFSYRQEIEILILICVFLASPSVPGIWYNKNLVNVIFGFLLFFFFALKLSVSSFITDQIMGEQ